MLLGGLGKVVWRTPLGKSCPSRSRQLGACAVRATSEVGSDAISERLIKEVVALRADLKQGLAALTDPQGRLAERAALEELRVDSGAEFRSAYQVAYHIIGKDLKKLSSAVEALIMHVIDQDVGVQNLLSMLKKRLSQETQPNLEDSEEDALAARAVSQAMHFMDHLPSAPVDILKAIQHLTDILRERNPKRSKWQLWWEPYLGVVTEYYAAKHKGNHDKLKEVVATDFVMFALPTVLPRDILQSPVEVLEVDVLWPIVHDGLGGAEIRIGETKTRATDDKIKTAYKQLERSLLFLEWAFRLVHGDSLRLSLVGVVAVLNAGPEKHRLSETKRDSKIAFKIVKI